MAFVHLDEFPVMFGVLCAKQFDRHLAVERPRHRVSLSPRKKFPKTAKKCRWNDRTLRVFKTMGFSVGLPMTSIRRDA
jgi:hypothetical protein